MSRIRGPRDLWAGLLFIVFGAASIVAGIRSAAGGY